jgi:hypothetical protein
LEVTELLGCIVNFSSNLGTVWTLFIQKFSAPFFFSFETPVVYVYVCALCDITDFFEVIFSLTCSLDCMIFIGLY